MILQKSSLLVLALALAIAGLALWISRPRFWSRIWGAKVEVAGSQETEARIYRRQGNVMVVLAPDRLNDIYVIRTAQKEVAVTTGYYFWFVSGLGALAKDPTNTGINMLHEKNNFTDPRLQLGEHSAIFQDMKGETIKAAW